MAYPERMWIENLKNELSKFEIFRNVMDKNQVQRTIANVVREHGTHRRRRNQETDNLPRILKKKKVNSNK